MTTPDATYINYRIPTDLLNEVDEECKVHPLRPSRARLMTFLIRRGLEAERAAGKISESIGAA